MHEPRHPQTGHTWHKFSLSGLFIGISLRFCTEHIKRDQRTGFSNPTKMNESFGNRSTGGLCHAIHETAGTGDSATIKTVLVLES